jgi:hypothetical protein
VCVAQYLTKEKSSRSSEMDAVWERRGEDDEGVVCVCLGDAQPGQSDLLGCSDARTRRTASQKMGTALIYIGKSSKEIVLF